MHLRCALSVLVYAALAVHLCYAQNILIGVFGLFQPRELTITALPGSAVVIQADGKQFALDRSSGVDTAQMGIFGSGLILEIGGQLILTPTVQVANRNNGPADFVLAVPGKIRRQYRGTLEVVAASGLLLPMVAIGLETAVASAVQAESAPGTPLEALKAQAVVARSYYTAAKVSEHDAHHSRLRRPANRFHRVTAPHAGLLDCDLFQVGEPGRMRSKARSSCLE
jgi:hypothetical protein